MKGKWLHDPATVKARTLGKRPTKPAGDLVKGFAEIERLRETQPGLTVTFALTTNREIPFDLLVLVESWAKDANIEVDLWSVSRIAHFLDTDPSGQIIRRNHLGTPVKLLSRELLLEMGKRSIREHLPHAVVGESIRRDSFILERGDALVAGTSGMGKTTACAMALDAHIDKRLPAVVLKTEFLATAATMAEAIEGELRRQEPEIEAGAGVKALSLCTEEEPLLVLVEDVNRANNPALLLNKVLSWMRVSGNHSQRLWRAICPVWPRYLDVIEDQKRALETVTVLRVDRYSEDEAIRAVRKRAEVLGQKMDEHRARAITERLGLDPLLIGLHDLVSEARAGDVIQSYVEERLGIVAAQAQRTKSEVVHALHQLLRIMLEHRTLGPQWCEVISWLHGQDVTALLRDIAHEGSVISYSGTAETIEFRHDRVMYALFSAAIAEVLETNPVPDYIVDPFFAEMVAGAAVQVELPLERLLQLMDGAPTAAAHALKLASELDSSYMDIAYQALLHWLQQENVKEHTWANRRYAVARVLSEIIAPCVRTLIEQFLPDDRMWDPILVANFKNGSLRAGLQYLCRHEIGVEVSGKQSLLAQVKRIYGDKLIFAVGAVLRRTDLNQPGNAVLKTGALRLAGYLGDCSLAQSIRVCWDQDDSRGRELRSYLFAAARCCGADYAETLGPICDSWEALPQEVDAEFGQPAERLASDYVAWEFRHYVPRDAIRYFVERANASQKLRWPITYMLRTVDHPDAVEHIVRYMAESHAHAERVLRSDWERHSRKATRRMSLESKKRLLMIAQDEAEPDKVRRKAFLFWGLTIEDGDQDVARRFSVGSPLYEQALWIRARLRDRSVIKEVVGKIPENPEYWLSIERYLWSDALTEALDPILDRVAEEQSEYTDLEFMVADALGSVEPKRAVAMLKRRWAKLKSKPMIVQAMMLSTSPEAVVLVREAFTTSPNPGGLLKHFVSHATLVSNEKCRLYATGQLRNLEPYLDFFPECEIELLWHTCMEKGWLNFCNQHLEPRMQKNSYDGSLDIEYLDRALVATAYEIINLHYWLDSSVRRGVARDKIFTKMLDWIKQHDNEKALAIVGEIVSREANRREFQLFEVAVGPRSYATSTIEAIRFDVFSRSLI
ncbi:hypothetical protein O3S74_017250 [Alcaligenes nematophilus]|uniref:hypothetical protein n=1 Tax=Alcaligenes nematophilus TaxID=2994643 RepID=UPI0028D99A7E|nr:hypothetical protein [Alcaligenes nematophilus]MDT8470535.1 hypothetical protein [Alcaligenes nematophilus]